MDNPNSSQATSGIPFPSAADLGRLFDELAGNYDRHAVLEREVGRRLLERIALRRLDPGRVVDLGGGTGQLVADLKRRFRRAEVIQLDCSMNMCRSAAARSTRLYPLRVLRADLARVPLAARSVDLVLSNLALQWQAGFRTVFIEVRRILQPGGLFAFSLPGFGSLERMAEACGAAGLPGAIRRFPDLHELGDALVAAGFCEPVLDRERLTLTYPSGDSLVQELEATGASTHVSGWTELRSASGRLVTACPGLPGAAGPAVEWEMVYGLAAGPREGQPVRTDEGDLATYSVAALRRSRSPRPGR